MAHEGRSESGGMKGFLELGERSTQQGGGMTEEVAGMITGNRQKRQKELRVGGRKSGRLGKAGNTAQVAEMHQ